MSPESNNQIRTGAIRIEAWLRHQLADHEPVIEWGRTEDRFDPRAFTNTIVITNHGHTVCCELQQQELYDSGAAVTPKVISKLEAELAKIGH